MLILVSPILSLKALTPVKVKSRKQTMMKAGVKTNPHQVPVAEARPRPKKKEKRKNRKKVN
jgi:hypothetical protein